MSQAVMASIGFIDHPHMREPENSVNDFAKHITPAYHRWSKSGHTQGDFSEFSEHMGYKTHFQNALDRSGGPCTMDEYYDATCRNHPANRFAGKMTIARPGEYCDAWTLPRLEQCRKTFGLDAAE